ncbi:MAG TPA: hypothetical protein VKQ72_12330 [Aggregatilineales bacterium]|nr:hypothetical protein [Aggregatilineales bacterium]
MTTSSRTWFYNEPEHRPYYIEERVNQNLWATRFGSIYLDCVRAEPPFRMEGVWHDITVSIEWKPNAWFTLRSSKEDRTLIGGFVQVLGFAPALSYNDENGVFIVEWWRNEADKAKRLQEMMGHPIYTNLKTYKR